MNHHANLYSKQQISFLEENFQRINTHHIGKTAQPRRGFICRRNKFVLATLVESHYINIYANLHLNLCSRFQRSNMYYIRKTAHLRRGLHLLTEQVCFSNFGRVPLYDHFCHLAMKSVQQFQRRKFLFFIYLFVYFSFRCLGNQSSKWIYLFLTTLIETQPNIIHVKLHQN